MTANKMLIAVGVLIIIAIVGFYIYLLAMSSAYSLHKPDKRLFYLTTEPMVIKNISLPAGSVITYKEGHFWQRRERKKPLDEKDIMQISFGYGTTIDWGGIPITLIVKFYNSEMHGYSVYPDLDKLDLATETEFIRLWKRCSDDLGITVANENDWSFNKQNIVDIESCGMSQRYYKEDPEMQSFLDSLFIELKKIKD